MLLVVILFLSSYLYCFPAPYLYKLHVRYNFTDEGFLDADLFQVRGQAKGGEHCLREARSVAERRALRAFLHLRFDLPPLVSDGLAAYPTALSTVSHSDHRDARFESDYPRQFSPSEYREAATAFHFLLSRAFLALQDSRQRDFCQVVLRIPGKDLPAEIRKTVVQFSSP